MIWTSPYFILACVLLYLVVTLWIVSRWHLRETTEEDYYVAGRNVGYIPNSLSIVAALMSGGIYLGTVGLFYLNGVGFLAFGFAYIFTLFPLWWIGKRLWPLAKTFQYTTPQDFYGHFYQSHLLRLLGATGSIVFLIPYMASNAVAMGTILERFTNVPYSWGVGILLAVGVGYTLYGGMRSVIYTDVFQGVISLGFGLAAVITFLYLAGGYQRMVDALPARMLVFSDDWVSYGAFIGWFVFIAANPLTMSDRMTRMYTIRDLNEFRRNVVLTGGILLVMVMIFVFLGLGSYYFVGAGQEMDQAILVAILQQAPWLMAWLVVAAWASGLSTLDSGLIGADAMLTKDIIRSYWKKDLSQYQTVWLGRYAMVVFGLLAAWIALARPEYIWALIKLVIMYHMQFLPLLIGALYWPRASKLGAEVGWLAGVILGTYYTFFSPTPPPIPLGEVPGPGVFALLVNTILFVSISFLVPPVAETHRARFEHIWENSPEP